VSDPWSQEIYNPLGKEMHEKTGAVTTEEGALPVRELERGWRRCDCRSRWEEQRGSSSGNFLDGFEEQLCE
jgi:hypothetical protein